ncbi:MAG: cytochrome c oxidase subunit II [SAR86 cluster bacterium]|uniref:Cytochrome c oxidase subunit 2 n=1 Tax=SAR86 cluster bacterium TaxID=2030880 RepID=A0A2A5CJ50_9GAMM|nr:cytochrome c oxidase subunit II [Gammaproteobacteria bacterium AH-315-E17]PCJ43531.1 MAG: cytochrome c oxidase subunit II [SAR86 cluster bacterium]
MQPKNKFLLGLLSSALVLISTHASAAWELNMPVGVTNISRETYDLHMLITIVCALIGVVVYGVLIWSLVKYRKSKGAKAASFHENTTIEIIWTVIPILILVAMAIPSTTVLRQIYDTSESELDIMITGYQWRWQYSYLDDEGEEVSFFSNLSTTDDQIAGLDEKGENYLLEVDEPLVIPVNTKVRFLLTAADVIHSWWVPEFAVKKDAIPGFINESWVIVEETGIYRGQCTELCGQDHGFMPVVVEVVEKAEFDIWYSERQEAAAAIAELTDQDWTLEQLVVQGETVYRTFCMACHQANGQGLPPAFPALTGSEITTGPIEDHINVVLNGVPGTAMAAFGAQLNPVDLAAVITYERNALGNSVGDFVAPIDILQAQAE